MNLNVTKLESRLKKLDSRGKAKWLSEFARDLAQQPGTFDLAVKLSRRPLRESRELALLLIALTVGPERVTVAFELVIELANSQDWEEREYAADALGSIIHSHFEQLKTRLRGLHRDESDNVRRCVVVAYKYAAKQRDPKQIAFILQELSKYMGDQSPYVRKNLGPFAIGDALLSYAPNDTLKMLSRCAKSRSELVRESTAQALTTAAAAKLYPMTRQLLLDLLADPALRVKRHALKGLKKVDAYKPGTSKEKCFQKLL